MRRLIPAALLLAACAADLDTADPAALSDGTPEAIGVLRFVNGPAADVATLDVDAALDARAARNIVGHVRGPDGLLGTGDDDLVGTIAELDGIAQVGPATIDRLVAYVDSIGGVPRIELEGVLLTEAEAEAILLAARGATLEELDVDAGLDARAASSLIVARPLADLAAVGAAPYVGPTAIDKLRRWAPGWSAAPCSPELLQAMRDCVDTAIMEQMITLTDAVAYCMELDELTACHADYVAELNAGLCRADDDCAAPARCQGIPHDGSTVLGRCVDVASRPGEGEPCAAADPCGAGLVCAGLTLWDDGICVADWMAGTFTVEIPTAIAASAGAEAASQVVVRGLATVPVDIEVSVDLAGVDARRLRLELTDPNGTTSILWNGEAATLPARLLPGNGISRDEAVNGAWTLAASTTGTGTAGTIDGWQLHLTSRWD